MVHKYFETGVKRLELKIMRPILLLYIFSITTLNVIAQNQFGHVISEDKNLPKEWSISLFDTGKQKIYRGEELKTIGMPCGGIAAGQLYVRGDGTLANWWIANNAYNTGYGIDHLLNFETAQGPWKVCYQTFEPFSYFKQGFKIKVDDGNKTYERELNKNDFNNVGFIGEYPIAKILYEDKDKKLPLDIQMEVFSPFIPLNARESAFPATVLKFYVKNVSSEKLDVNLSGYIQNIVMSDLKDHTTGMLRNQKSTNNVIQSLYMDFVPDSGIYNNHAYNGNISLSIFDNNGQIITDINSSTSQSVTRPLGDELIGNVSSSFVLNPHENREVVFLLSWYFPNRPLDYRYGGNWNEPIPATGSAIGNMYANWFNSSLDVASVLYENFDKLSKETYNFHNAWYNKSNLPYWLKQRIMMPVSTLATETCQWWANDKFWAWEGVGSCVGTCTHVYNYEQAIAQLFPELERNIRERTDFGTSYNEDGSVDSRNGWGGVLLDGHIGTILKSYREYQMSKDNLFLSRNWNKIKKAMNYAMEQDGDLNGLIEGRQSNTYDISFMGPNTYVGSLYLTALRAAEEMALIMDDSEFAELCHKVFESGKELSVERLWNGNYFIQEVNLEINPKFQYANGCLSDQLFGQTWAHLLNLGYIYPEEYVKKALKSVWKYNWTLDVGPHIQAFKPERYYARSGEPGLLNCTWPLSEHLNENAVRYRNEVWTGIEYQVATNMIYEGMLEEGLSLVRAIHERYNPVNHNPWNEVECGDHYARALASFGVLTALEDFCYSGPDGILKFAPKIKKDDITCFYTGAEGWGTLSQKKTKSEQINSITVNYGRLSLKSVEIKVDFLPRKVNIRSNSKDIPVKYNYENGRLTLSFDEINLNKDNVLTIHVS